MPRPSQGYGVPGKSETNSKLQIFQADSAALGGSQSQLAIVRKRSPHPTLSLRERRTATAAGEGNVGHYRGFAFRAYLIRACLEFPWHDVAWRRRRDSDFRISARTFWSVAMVKTNCRGMSARSIGAQPKGNGFGSGEAILSIKKIGRAPHPNGNPERPRSDHDHGQHNRDFPLYRYWFARGECEFAEWISHVRGRAGSSGGTHCLRAQRRQECNQHRQRPDGTKFSEMASHNIHHVWPAVSSIAAGPVDV